MSGSEEMVKLRDALLARGVPEDVVTVDTVSYVMGRGLGPEDAAAHLVAVRGLYSAANDRGPLPPDVDFLNALAAFSLEPMTPRKEDLLSAARKALAVDPVDENPIVGAELTEADIALCLRGVASARWHAVIIADDPRQAMQAERLVARALRLVYGAKSALDHGGRVWTFPSGARVRTFAGMQEQLTGWDFDVAIAGPGARKSVVERARALVRRAPESILAEIDAWHEAKTEEPIHTWLRMTEEEFREFVEGPGRAAADARRELAFYPRQRQSRREGPAGVTATSVLREVLETKPLRVEVKNPPVPFDDEGIRLEMPDGKLAVHIARAKFEIGPGMPRELAEAVKVWARAWPEKTPVDPGRKAAVLSSACQCGAGAGADCEHKRALYSAQVVSVATGYKPGMLDMVRFLAGGMLRLRTTGAPGVAAVDRQVSVTGPEWLERILRRLPVASTVHLMHFEDRTL